MAREGLRSHLSGSVPISIGVHFVVLLVLVVVPLADIVVPIPALTMPDYVLAAALPPPPEFVRPTVAPSPSATPSPEIATVPIKAPEEILPETVTTPPSMPTPGALDSLVGESGILGAVGPPVAPAIVPPEPPKAQGPVRVAQLPEPPRKTVDVRPIYPEVARIARVEGTVILESVLDTNGRVTQTRVIRSVPLLDQAALDAVRQWRYAPSMYGGRPVSVLMTITVRFTLQQ